MWGDFYHDKQDFANNFQFWQQLKRINTPAFKVGKVKNRYQSFG
ncbi:MAG: hypothetical protein AB8B69_06060 [Chitinophagales bacterium]